MKIYYKDTYTYKLFELLAGQVDNFISTLGEIVSYGLEFLKGFKSYNTSFSEIMTQCSRFGVSSLPITLSIVGMTSIIISMQVAGEMVKQGGGNFVGMLMAILTIREEGAIMSGFAIISMIGSSLASEIATMKVTEQIDAIKVLKVNPVHYLFTPRIIAGTLMMPLVVIIASLFGIIGGALASNIASELSFKAYFDSVWFGLSMRDLNVCILKSLSFGFAISLISCCCGMSAKDGAKGVGLATTKAVVWSFVAIVIIDFIYAAAFFY
ncbi:MAG: ABC transporter permease [Cyanobacteria bacterium SIG28]|nr:ABC transporter permease [Cyanobacteria bacterium SIG28]